MPNGESEEYMSGCALITICAVATILSVVIYVWAHS